VLERLEVRDLALIDALNLEPGPGLNLVTGETGSGKTLLLDALGFAVGGRASADLVRAQADSVQVTAVFAPPAAWARRWKPWFDEKGLPWEDGQLLLKRELQRGGKGRAWINGEAAPMAVLAELGQALVDFHGQHDHQSLLRVAEHRETLDRFGTPDEALERVAQAFDAAQALRRDLEGPGGDPQARRRQLEFLDFQVREMEDLAPKDGEWESLRSAAGLQAGAGKRAEALAAAHSSLNGEEQGALAGLQQALAALRRLPEGDPSRRALLGRLESLMLELRDVGEGVRSALDTVELDPAALERLQARLHAWEKLAHKQQCPPQDLAQAFGRLRGERDGLAELLRDEEGLKKALERAREAYASAALALGAARDQGAARLIKVLTKELQELVGPGALFTVRLKRREDPAGPFLVGGTPCRGDRGGVDDVEFLFAPNPGEQPKPLARIASGGELSRLALALKTVFSRQEGAPSLVFDEIDAGISGRVAALVGDKIAALARRHQVFCITHLPQIASLPARHFKVSKSSAKGRTVTTVLPLDAQGREAEVASLLGGEAAGASALAHARELLARGVESVA
jgi:DNA repair protein RecN (Recombination protein N)